MKNVLFALLLIPFLAGCNWWKKESNIIQTDAVTTEENHSKLQNFETLMGEAEEDDNYLDQPVNGETLEK